MLLSPLLGLYTSFICRFILVDLPATPSTPWFHEDCIEATFPVASCLQMFLDLLGPLDFLTFFSSGERLA